MGGGIGNVYIHMVTSQHAPFTIQYNYGFYGGYTKTQNGADRTNTLICRTDQVNWGVVIGVV